LHWRSAAVVVHSSAKTHRLKKGGIMGIASSFTLLGNLISPISSGYIASYTSIDFIFILAGCCLLLAQCLFTSTSENL
jgi:MFS family permease